MTKQLHTPAPWRAAKTPLNPWWNIYIGEGERSIAEVEGARAIVWNDPESPQAVEANAHLIAAAPDLLQKLKQALIMLESVHGLSSLDDFRAVIARAEGGA